MYTARDIAHSSRQAHARPHPGEALDHGRGARRVILISLLSRSQSLRDKKCLELANARGLGRATGTTVGCPFLRRVTRRPFLLLAFNGRGLSLWRAGTHSMGNAVMLCFGPSQ